MEEAINEPAARAGQTQIDSLQQRLTDYACALTYQKLTPQTVHAAKVCFIDTVGALVGGFFSEPGRIVRKLAAQTPNPAGSTVLGARIRTTPDLAAFANATTVRVVEMTDVYHWPGAFGGHPSDTLMPVFAAAEYVRSSGRDLITALVLAYEVFLRLTDTLHDRGFDHTNFCTVGTAIAAGKLFGLSSDALAHCISMAAVPNNILRQVRTSHLSMFKSAATGQAGRAGVFAALLARAGMEGPHLPFEGKAGWCEHIAGKRFTLPAMGGEGAPFKILDLRFKYRAARGTTIPAILAAEQIAPLGDVDKVEKVCVEVYRRLKKEAATGAHFWNPDSRESAAHSAPYVVATALIDGAVTPRSFDEAHLANPKLHALMQKVEFVENEEYTRCYEQPPVIHRTRITVTMKDGRRMVGETGGGADDPSQSTGDAQIEAKFRTFTEDYWGSTRVGSVLELLWHLDDVPDVAQIPAMLKLE